MLIVELGHNHNGDMFTMRKLIRTAKDCGADVVKFQLYKTDSLFKKDFEWYWDLKRGELTYSDWMKVAEECRDVGIKFFASVFDIERIKWCEDVKVKRYKIASRSIYDKPLVDAIVQTGKPIIASLGMYYETEFPSFNADFLYCIAKYPTPFIDLHLGSVDFNRYDGFSDHTIGIEAAMVALSRGARIIEKHFTLDKTMDGADHKGSMNPEELRALVDFADKVRVIL